MRDLVQSRWIVGLLIGFFVLAGQTAIPVPSVVFSQMSAPMAEGASCPPTVCRCVGCSPATCCCAMVAPPSDDAGGVAMFGYSCQPKVDWFVAVLPPVIASPVIGLVEVPGFLSTSRSSVLAGSTRDMGVPTPPPKAAA